MKLTSFLVLIACLTGSVSSFAAHKIYVCRGAGSAYLMSVDDARVIGERVLAMRSLRSSAALPALPYNESSWMTESFDLGGDADQHRWIEVIVDDAPKMPEVVLYVSSEEMGMQSGTDLVCN